jgi:trehalose-6-phosphate synthase
MPGDERRDRWNTMMRRLRGTSVQSWFADFVAALGESRPPLAIVSPSTAVPAVIGGTERSAASPI